jgi:lipopolysaccharide biosynthesis regulator YciM
MEQLAKQPYPKEIAQYHCELAADALLHARHDDARRHLDDAIAEHKLCARATMIAGDVAAAQDDYATAVGTWQRIESQNPAFLALVADRIADGYRRLGDPQQGIRLLESWLDRYPSLDLLNSVYTVTREEKGVPAAAGLLRDELHRHPTLPGLAKLLEAELLTASPERRHDLEVVKDLIAQHARRLGMYRCDHCGFRARTYYWRCPGCGKWETYPPKRTETPDGSP